MTESGVLSKGHNADAKVSYTFVNDSRGLPEIREYFNEALKTLGKKPKKKLTFSIEQEGADDGYF